MSSIDVGCMQVNLAYHGDAFDRIEDALDPIKNVAYAAHLLTTLKEQHGSWSATVAAYHSSKPERATPYCQKVAETWQGFGGTVMEDTLRLRRTAILETFESRRAAFAAHQADVLRKQDEQRRARMKPQFSEAVLNRASFGRCTAKRAFSPATSNPSNVPPKQSKRLIAASTS
ncbi:MAG: lytic transglycosylase domain-containing protein [Alphaproteobacteria bacterium]|nr:lytic transglycosylase domain-containing protein [Alphaproteobacteria bacterium]